MVPILLHLKKLLFVIILLMPSALSLAAEATPLFAQAMPDYGDKEGIMLTVTYEPGETSAAHRHNAHVFVYVLEGSVLMQVAGGETQTLQAGEVFYEKPGDVHTVSGNASETEPATILVFMLKDEGAPVSMPAD
jgi:quercetin dioxygenase-like cupin family protein